MDIIIKEMNSKYYVLSFVKNKFYYEAYYECPLLQKNLKC